MAQSSAEGGAYENREEDNRYGHLDIYNPHNDLISPATEVSCYHAEEDAEHTCEEDTGSSSNERSARTGHNLAKNIPAQMVGAKKVTRASAKE